MTTESDIVLFDGDCALCNATVLFIIEHDPKGRYRFAPQQSPLGRDLLTCVSGCGKMLDSVVLIEKSGVFLRSEAVLRICRHLCWPWPLLSVGLILPRRLRDWAYRLVARLRYRVFGKTNACQMPTPAMKARLLP